MTPPKFLFLQTNQRCNLKCTHCMYWKNTDERSSYLSLNRRLELMSEFRALGGDTIITCGGEPMLDLEEYFELCVGARSRNLRLLSVVNGTKVSTPEIAKKMVQFGPSEITISIDHYLPAENDRLRGVTGAWKSAVRAVDLLLKAREQYHSSTPIYVMTIVSNDTWQTLDEFYDFALTGLGVDKLKLNIIQPTFQGTGPDTYYESAMIQDVDGCMAMIRKCDYLFEINRNPQWLLDVEMYLRSVKRAKSSLLGWSSIRGTERAICNSYDRNIMIDLYGNARLCFSTIYPEVKLEKRGDLYDYWTLWSRPIRDCMVGCKQFCGISHSVRKEPSTL